MLSCTLERDEMTPVFNERKAAQVAAYFAREQGGSIEILKLVKLIYLADREFLKRYDALILNDRFVSMPHGPVNSITLNYLNGLIPVRAGWSEFITDRAEKMVGTPRNDLPNEALDELSLAELEVLQHTWDTFGKMSAWDLREWTHKNCLEWEDPQGSSNPIPYVRVLRFLGKDDSEAIAEAIDEEISLAGVCI